MLKMFKINKACKFPKKKNQFKNKRQQKDPTN